MDSLELGEKLATRSNTNLEFVTKAEAQSWRSHPCTKALINQLESDMAMIQHSWSIGGFTGKSDSETIQLNSEALGSVKGTKFVLEWIEDLLTREDEEDVES